MNNIIIIIKICLPIFRYDLHVYPPIYLPIGFIDPLFGWGKYKYLEVWMG